MSFSSTRFNGRRSGFVSGRGVIGRGQHKPRFFDPSYIIANAQQQIRDNVEDPSIGEIYVPKYSFSDFNISPILKENILARGYEKPTPIQDQAIPEILKGLDVVGLARTGTGKTAAFLIPLINKAFLDRSQRVLIVTPTRELAVQIRDELSQFAIGMNIDSVLCIGGVNIAPQAFRLRRRPQFVIGTPGRLKDLEEQRDLNFAHFNNIVLDEVDRMLDIGFVIEVRRIISRLPQNRLSLFFSATMSPEVSEIMNGFLKNPVTISIKSENHVNKVLQSVIKTNGKPKVDVLHELLITEGFSKVLVFGRTKFGMDKLAEDLFKRGFKVAAIHGNKNQGQRQRALNDFKNSIVQILLATDVASRGLDIKDVTHVINYDLPETYEDYIHRIGRTARANKSGSAITFV